MVSENDPRRHPELAVVLARFGPLIVAVTLVVDPTAVISIHDQLFALSSKRISRPTSVDAKPASPLMPVTALAVTVTLPLVPEGVRVVVVPLMES